MAWLDRRIRVGLQLARGITIRCSTCEHGITRTSKMVHATPASSFRKDFIKCNHVASSPPLECWLYDRHDANTCISRYVLTQLLFASEVLVCLLFVFSRYVLLLYLLSRPIAFRLTVAALDRYSQLSTIVHDARITSGKFHFHP